MIGKSTAVVCLSGGVDSCVTAGVAARSHELALLHVNYGQRTEARELKSFRDIADFYKVERRLAIDLDFLGKIGGSSLTDPSQAVPEGDLGRPGIPSTYVPFRNANLLAIGVAWSRRTARGIPTAGRASSRRSERRQHSGRDRNPKSKSSRR